ncbi:MASE1 domain-containing protein [Actinophytocola sp. NPDC049390]|uniref:MASE1 domain-containing protein n=1 Tax=Actinophytocola sp. NPDC049390 TaxID=3363894 RepID=UPI00378EF778
MPPTARPLPARGVAAYGVRILAVAVAYFLSAEIGLELALVRGQVTPLWPPTGIALACLLLFGMRCWPGITIGAFLTNVLVGPTLPAVVAISASNTLAPVCACLVLARVGFRSDLRRLRDALALVFIAALGGMLLSATIGTWTLIAAGALDVAQFWATWSVWWTGDAMGVLVVAPVLLVAGTREWHWRVPALRWAEAVGLVVGVTAVTLVVTRLPFTMLFPVFPLLIWAALRFQHAGVAPCNLFVSVTVVLAAAHGHGPFAGLDLLSTMITLQVFNGAATLTALLLAAIISERDAAERALERAAAQLSEAVRMLEPYSLLSNGLFGRAFGRRERPAPSPEPTSGTG